ncbi:MAG: type II toxin-antitoxin system RelE/ParE family toxin [Halobacteriovoraceae bacterium]|nr:type II toxin-antitoxin system RelE/ParE family toxin [Halobacteriovoraceae bacterium]
MATKKIDYYVTENDKAPFLEWVNNLDMASQLKVDRLIQRVAQGGAKKSIKSLKDGVFEIKIPHGPGLRVYFGEDGDKLILLLVGGDKGTQSRDIKKAKEYWSNYGKQK